MIHTKKQCPKGPSIASLQVASPYIPPVRLKEVLKRRPVNHEVLKRKIDKPHTVSAVISYLKPKGCKKLFNKSSIRMNMK